MSRKAVIDIGTNSIKFFVGDNENNELKTVLDTVDVVRLGEGLNKTGLLSQQAMERNASSVAAFFNKAKDMGCDEIEAVGTMALRSAGNSLQFISLVREKCGLEVNIIPGEEEARLSYLAAASSLHKNSSEDIVIFDTGGGSTEFIFGKGQKLVRRFSINLGAVRILEDFLNDDPIDKEKAKSALMLIEKELKEAGLEKISCPIIGIGGTVTTMASVKYKMESFDPDIIEGSSLTLKDIDDQINMYISMPLEERKKIKGLEPKRADVIAAGALILKGIAEVMGKDEITVSVRGLRHQLAREEE